MNENNIEYILQKYSAKLPYFKKANLICDGRSVACLPSGLKSGKILGKDVILSSLISGSGVEEIKNINFNPHSDAISIPCYYNAPALAVSRNDLPKIFAAKKVSGQMSVVAKKHEVRNILVGNSRNPKNIFFAHYDSISLGACDNASGVSVMLSVLLSDQSNLKENLYVFSANEELSFDWPYYWGKGYREFEKKYLFLLKKVKNIFVIDSVGNDKTIEMKDLNMILLAFPIENISKFNKKTIVITGNFDKLMSVYHSELDNGKNINEKYLVEAENLVIKKANG